MVHTVYLWVEVRCYVELNVCNSILSACLIWNTYLHMCTCSTLPLSQYVCLCLFCAAVCWAGQWHCTHTACRKWNKSPFKPFIPTLSIVPWTDFGKISELLEFFPAASPATLIAWCLRTLAPVPACYPSPTSLSYRVSHSSHNVELELYVCLLYPLRCVWGPRLLQLIDW